MDSDEGSIEDVNDDDFKTVANQSPQFTVFSIFSLTMDFFETYGWFLLKGFDEEKEVRRLQQIEAVRQRQQAALDAAAAKYLEEKKLKEERLAQERAEEWERHQKGLGYHSKTKVKEDDLSALGLEQRNKSTSKPKLKRDDYNPLTGQSSSRQDGPACSYRPSRKGGNRGG